MTRLQLENKDLSDLLVKERAQFNEDRETFRVENDRRAATTEREKAELQESLERQAIEWRSRQERYEKELREMKAILVKVRTEIQQYRDQVLKTHIA